MGQCGKKLIVRRICSGREQTSWNRCVGCCWRHRRIGRSPDRSEMEFGRERKRGRLPEMPTLAGFLLRFGGMDFALGIADLLPFSNVEARQTWSDTPFARHAAANPTRCGGPNSLINFLTRSLIFPCCSRKDSMDICMLDGTSHVSTRRRDAQRQLDAVIRSGQSWASGGFMATAR